MFVLACAFGLAFENGFDHAIAMKEDEGPVSSSFANLGFIYQRIVTGGPRRTQPRYTAIVGITPDKDPPSVNLSNVCEQREFLARLVKAIARSAPSVIAIDKNFQKETCQSNNVGTLALIHAIQEVQENIPVIVGQVAQVADDKADVEPTLEFGPSGPTTSLLNVHVDERRLALDFVLDHPAPAHLERTFARQAAAAHNPGLFSSDCSVTGPDGQRTTRRDCPSRVKQMEDDKTYPFISFLPEDGFVLHPAIEVLCGQGANRNEWRSCKPEQAKRIPELRSRIVLIGESNSRLDQHHSVVGRIPGLFLQANYIESILDERLFPPARPFANYAIGFVIYFAFELILVAETAVVVTVARTIGLFGLSLLLCYATALTAGFYLNPVTVSMASVVVRLIGLLPERVKHWYTATSRVSAQDAGVETLAPGIPGVTVATRPLIIVRRDRSKSVKRLLEQLGQARNVRVIRDRRRAERRSKHSDINRERRRDERRTPQQWTVEGVVVISS